MLALIAVGLLYVAGLTIVQSSTIVTALPLLPILFILAISIRKHLKSDFGHMTAPDILTVPTEKTEKT